MERLVTTAQAAQILGLSLQGVHYRIKNNQLKSIKKSGKTYVYISEYVENKQNESKEKPAEIVEIREIIKVKDEHISLLKKNIKWMKKQYTSEIIRLENNQTKIMEVFNREIELLQSAFNEMRSIYKPQIEQQKTIQPHEVQNKDYLTLKEFSIFMKNRNKSDKDIKNIILKAIKNSDNRFLYNKKTKQILIENSDFRDLL